jgi:hypothetical protein
VTWVAWAGALVSVAGAVVAVVAARQARTERIGATRALNDVEVLSRLLARSQGMTLIKRQP